MIRFETGPTESTRVAIPVWRSVEGNALRGDRAICLTSAEARRIMDVLREAGARCESMAEADCFDRVATMLCVALQHPEDRILPAA
jgi:hypothetical protein